MIFAGIVTVADFLFFDTISETKIVCFATHISLKRLPPQKCEFLYTEGGVADLSVSENNKNDSASLLDSPLWKPVDFSKFGDASANAPKGLWGIFLAGMLGGLLAIFTPCVWPIIPMTVSMFIKRAGSRKESIRDAIVYGLSIIVIYVGLGLLITLLFGASALNALATHAVLSRLCLLASRKHAHAR